MSEDIDALIAAFRVRFEKLAPFGPPMEFPEKELRAFLASRGMPGRPAAEPAPASLGMVELHETPEGRIASYRQQQWLRMFAHNCLYAAQPGWRGCGCRGCYAKSTRTNPAPDVSLRECLACVSHLVKLIDDH